ncbi:MAG: DUF2797 domain-containing protein [Candidatus Berkiella sp.]
MSLNGTLSKMVVSATQPVSYQLPLSDHLVPLNDYLGQTLHLKFTGDIYCINCDTRIKKSYQDGYCFPCVQRLARADLCIVKPERCHFHLGTCKEPEWGQSHCMIPHCVYLANSSGIKVGITRKTQVATRWIDQGAIAALPFFEVATRRVSGLLEVAIAKHVADKTNWRKMLMGHNEPIDLIEYRTQLMGKLSDDIAKIHEQFGQQSIKVLEDATVVELSYPVLAYPQKVTSLSFDKHPSIQSKLLGIKGQYLIFEAGVINIRKHSGYKIVLTT